MKNILFLIFILTPIIGLSQIFSETFDEPNSSTSGSDNIGSVSWFVTCPTCIDANDWFEVQSNKLESRDTNGPATFTTNPINTSSCDWISISMSISESGTMEACGSGCNSVDWVSLEYRIDGGAWTYPTNSYFCSGNCAGINVIHDDDISGTLNFFSDCFFSGSSLEFRISVQSWASTEYWEIDDIEVNCVSCILPIELISFEGENVDNVNQLKWITASEINNDYFTIERSEDAISWEVISYIPGSGNSNIEQSYYYRDYNFDDNINYYRLTQTDFDGKSETFDVISIDNRIINPRVVKIINLLGQEVDMNYKGLKIIIYSDDTVVKKY